MSVFLWKLGLTVKERNMVVVVKYFQFIGLFVSSCGFPSGLSSFFIRCINFKMVRGSLRNILVLFHKS